MILCHDLKEILQGQLLKNVFVCLSTYFNRSLIGKQQAAKPRRKQRSSVWLASEAGHRRAGCAHLKAFEFTAGLEHCRIPASAKKLSWLEIIFYIWNMLYRRRLSILTCLPLSLLSENHCTENRISFLCLLKWMNLEPVTIAIGHAAFTFKP